MAIRSEAHWFDLIDDFTAAAVDTGDWDRALRGLADATGSSRGQLIGVGGAGGVPFNWVTNLEDSALADFIAIDGGSEWINPRVAAGMRADVLETVSEADYEQVRPRLRSRIYEGYAAEYDIPFGCQTNLIRDSNMLIGLAVLRTAREGPTSTGEREAFATLAPHIRSAVRTQMLLEGQSAALVAGSLEAVSLAAFVCDGRGEVRATTPAAEDLLRDTPLLSLRAGRLGSPDRAGAAVLDRAVRRAGAGPDAADKRPVASTVTLRDAAAALPPLVLDVLPLPRRRWSLAFDARLLVVPRGRRRGGDAAAVLEAGYRLTPAEAAIALALVSGRSREQIAADRGVSIGTVRTQLKSIFGKVDVTREIDLAARIHALL